MNNQGWECPKCGRGNAPWVPQCSCQQTGSSNKTTLPSSEINFLKCMFWGTSYSDRHKCYCHKGL